MELYLFHHITENPVIQALIQFAQTRDEESYFSAARGLLSYANRRVCDRNLIQEYLLRCMLEEATLPDVIHLRDYMRHDIKLIYNLFWETDWDALCRDCGYLPISSPPVPVTEEKEAGYAFSLTAMIDCTSNEALGGAILAHLESFGLPSGV